MVSIIGKKEKPNIPFAFPSLHAFLPGYAASGVVIEEKGKAGNAYAGACTEENGEGLVGASLGHFGLQHITQGKTQDLLLLHGEQVKEGSIGIQYDALCIGKHGGRHEALYEVGRHGFQRAFTLCVSSSHGWTDIFSP
jgi:hypothetical protein